MGTIMKHPYQLLVVSFSGEFIDANEDVPANQDI